MKWFVRRNLNVFFERPERFFMFAVLGGAKLHKLHKRHKRLKPYQNGKNGLKLTYRAGKSIFGSFGYFIKITNGKKRTTNNSNSTANGTNSQQVTSGARKSILGSFGHFLITNF
jgi:hypothetical protein